MGWRISNFWTCAIIFILAFYVTIALMIVSSISAVHASDSSCYKDNKDIRTSYQYSVGVAIVSGLVAITLYVILLLMFGYSCWGTLGPFIVTVPS